MGDGGAEGDEATSPALQVIVLVSRHPSFRSFSHFLLSAPCISSHGLALFRFVSRAHAFAHSFVASPSSLHARALPPQQPCSKQASRRQPWVQVVLGTSLPASAMPRRQVVAWPGPRSPACPCPPYEIRLLVLLPPQHVASSSAPNRCIKMKRNLWG